MTATLRDRKKERTRRAISDAALALMAERGYAATTMGDIAEAADVSPRTVFRHFADKEDVVFADDAEHLEALVAAIDAAPPARSTPAGPPSSPRSASPACRPPSTPGSPTPPVGPSANASTRRSPS